MTTIEKKAPQINQPMQVVKMWIRTRDPDTPPATEADFSHQQVWDVNDTVPFDISETNVEEIEKYITSVTSGTPPTFTSVELPAGVWLLEGSVSFWKTNPAGSADFSRNFQWFNLTDNKFVGTEVHLSLDNEASPTTPRKEADGGASATEIVSLDKPTVFELRCTWVGASSGGETLQMTKGCQAIIKSMNHITLQPYRN